MPTDGDFTGKQRMLAAYRGQFADRVAIAPEFWYYYPAKLLGVDMIEFQRDVPFHQALKTTFETFDCEGWGVAFAGAPAEDVEATSRETWIDSDTLEVRSTARTPYGDLTSAQRSTRDEPPWSIERPVKTLERDLAAWEHVTFTDPEQTNVEPLIRAWQEVGESYLLEAWLGVPFFDAFAGSREGGFERGVLDCYERPGLLERLRRRHMEHMVDRARVICRRTPIESLCIGCSWSCNSLLGPDLWRRWDKPVIQAVADEVHRHGRLLHIHFHGKCLETVADFARIGIDCVCPFERPPGGDVDGADGLRQVERLLDGRVTMNGNVHTVETLIRGTPADVRREVDEIMEAFGGNPRLIVGTGDQVGRETPADNAYALVEHAKDLSPRWTA